MLSRKFDYKTSGQSLSISHETLYQMQHVKKSEETPTFARIQGFHPHTSQTCCALILRVRQYLVAIIV